MKRALPIVLTAVALAFAVVGVYGLVGPWWASLATGIALLLFVITTDWETS